MSFHNILNLFTLLKECIAEKKNLKLNNCNIGKYLLMYIVDVLLFVNDVDTLHSSGNLSKNFKIKSNKIYLQEH